MAVGSVALGLLLRHGNIRITCGGGGGGGGGGGWERSAHSQSHTTYSLLSLPCSNLGARRGICWRVGVGWAERLLRDKRVGLIYAHSALGAVHRPVR